MPRPNQITIMDARILPGQFRNFAGREEPFNKEGERGFNVVLTPELATELDALDWNVKMLKPKEEGDEETPFLPVKVSYKLRAPVVVLITSISRTNLTESEIGILDWADIIACDMILNGNFWDVNGKTGIKAYLQKMYVTIEVDELDIKYAVPELVVP